MSCRRGFGHVVCWLFALLRRSGKRHWIEVRGGMQLCGGGGNLAAVSVADDERAKSASQVAACVFGQGKD